MLGDVVTGRFDRLLTPTVFSAVRELYDEINAYNPCPRGLAALRKGELNNPALYAQFQGAVQICATELVKQHKAVLLLAGNETADKYVGFDSNKAWEDPYFDFRGAGSLATVIKTAYPGADLIGACGAGEYSNLHRQATAQKFYFIFHKEIDHHGDYAAARAVAKSLPAIIHIMTETTIKHFEQQLYRNHQKEIEQHPDKTVAELQTAGIINSPALSQTKLSMREHD